jgi:hypothetical protein
MLKTAGHKDIDPSFVWFVDSSFADVENKFSTGGYVGMIMGGPVDCASFVPKIIPMSTAEAELNANAVACMAIAHVKMAWQHITTGNPDTPLTVPLFTDSTAAKAIVTNEKDSKRTRHIARRQLFCKHEVATSKISLHHIGADFQLSDCATKSLPAAEAAPRLAVIEDPHAPEVTSQSTTLPRD